MANNRTSAVLVLLGQMRNFDCFSPEKGLDIEDIHELVMYDFMSPTEQKEFRSQWDDLMDKGAILYQKRNQNPVYYLNRNVPDENP